MTDAQGNGRNPVPTDSSMPAEPLRILILEDVRMDAELVEYELARASIPF